MLRPVLPAVRPFRAGAICLFAGRDARARRRDDRPGRRTRPASGTPRGSRPAAGWWARRSTGSSTTLPGQRRRAHRRRLPVPRGRAAAHGRVGRGRRQVHRRTRVSSTTRELRGAVKKAPRPTRAPAPPGRRARDARALHAGAGQGARRRCSRSPSRSTSRPSSTPLGRRARARARARAGARAGARAEPVDELAASPRTRPRTSPASRAGRPSRSRRSS